MLNFASVASGIEAPSVAWEPLGWNPIFFSEISPFQSEFLKTRYPDVPNLGDFSTNKFLKQAKTLHRKHGIDILIGGTPCQDFSWLGTRLSLSGSRGNLTLDYIRLIHELNVEWAIWENVTGALQTSDNAFGYILAALIGAEEPIDNPGRWKDSGMAIGPKRRAAWRVLDALGYSAQRRRRVFIVSSRSADRHDPSRVLFEEEADFITGVENRRNTGSLFSS